MVQIVTTGLAVADPGLFERMLLIPSKVLEGEVFRLLTFLVTPLGISIFVLCYWYMLYLTGTALENYWGTFRFNMFLLIGYLSTVTAAFITPDIPASNYFIKGSIFLAFAFLNPNFVLHIFFVLAIRIKWLAMLTWISTGIIFLTAEWPTRLAIAASVFNFFVFFGKDVWHRISDGNRHMVRQARQFAEKPPEYLHKCETCGITDTSHPKEEFRYCSRCVGDVAYCETHLRDHAHIVNMQDES